jgi:hypothetical protein
MRIAVLALSIIIILFACTSNDEPSILQDNFDREAMLINWSDNIIIPGYTAYVNDLSTLVAAKDAFTTDINEANFLILKSAWLGAYISWQKVSMFEIGRAETLTLRDYTNIFPTNASEIEANINLGTYDLTLPSKRDEQGFPAIDYLLHGIADTDADAVLYYNTNSAHLQYLETLIDRLYTLGSDVKNDWESGYRDAFVANSGSSASSSVNKLVNDYIFYFEKSLRAGKIGIPAGVFSSTPLADKVEAMYVKDKSKILFETALQASHDFFNGVYYNGTGSGESLQSYLVTIHSNGTTEDLSSPINSQFETAIIKGSELDDNFIAQIELNNDAMLATFDAIQANVILMKVDMFQALNIRVDYVDADGD